MFKEKMAYGKYEWYLYKTYKLITSKHFWIGFVKGFLFMFLSALVFISFYMLIWIFIDEDEIYKLNREKVNNSNYYQNTDDKTNQLANLKAYYQRLPFFHNK